MRIALINPNTHTKYPQPPLGLLSVATVCRQYGHSARIVDVNARRTPIKDIVRSVDCDDIVGLTATSLAYPEAMKIARCLRAAYPYKFLVIGGVHATVLSEEVMDSGLFDAVVCGEGEPLIKGLLDTRKRGIYYNPQELTDINTLPPLDYELLDGFKYRMSYGHHRLFMPILTDRGCPFKCAFCSRAVFGNNYRTKSIQNVITDVDRLINKFGIKEIKFYDDVFTLDKSRAIALSQQVGGQVPWTCMTRVNLVDQPTLKAMRKGGCYSVAYGIESANDSILKGLNKNTTVEQATQAVKYSHEAGLRVIGYFMLGCPGETVETIQNTVNFAIDSGVDYAQFSIATALPGSEWYELVPENLRANAYSMNDMDNPSLCELSPSQLKEALRQANRRFKGRK